MGDTDFTEEECITADDAITTAEIGDAPSIDEHCGTEDEITTAEMGDAPEIEDTTAATMRNCIFRAAVLIDGRFVSHPAIVNESVTEEKADTSCALYFADAIKARMAALPTFGTNGRPANSHYPESSEGDSDSDDEEGNCKILAPVKETHFKCTFKDGCTDACGKMFKGHSRMLDHIRSVHEKKTQKCQLCSKLFTYRCDVVRHHNRRHKDQALPDFQKELTKRRRICK
jgi:hypothetical protein